MVLIIKHTLLISISINIDSNEKMSEFILKSFLFLKRNLFETYMPTPPSLFLFSDLTVIYNQVYYKYQYLSCPLTRSRLILYNQNCNLKMLYYFQVCQNV